MTPARFRWGVMLIAIGAAVLLTNADVLGHSYWMELLSLWPIILIAIGIEKIFLHSKLRFISYLAPLLMVGTMVYVGLTSDNYRFYDGLFSSSRWSEDIDDSIKTIEANINHYRTDLQVSSCQTDLVRGRFDRLSRNPDIDFSKSDSLATLDIDYRSGGISKVIVFNRRRYDNDRLVSFSDRTALKLTCRGEDSEVDLGLSSIPVEEVTIDNDDGDIYLEIGTLQPEVFAEILGDESYLHLTLPENCGLKVKASGHNYDDYFESLDLTPSGDYFISNNFDSSTVKMNLKIDNDLRGITVNYQ